jgi:hypothetical protein
MDENPWMHCKGIETLTDVEKDFLKQIPPTLSDRNRRKDARRMARGQKPMWEVITFQQISVDINKSIW